jgi:hypothetical protein
MTRKKTDRVVWQHRFNLSSDNVDHQRLHDLLDSLANEDGAAGWIIQSLLTASNTPVQPQYNPSTTVVPKSMPLGDPNPNGHSVTPAEVIRLRKAAAQAKQGGAK